MSQTFILFLNPEYLEVRLLVSMYEQNVVVYFSEVTVMGVFQLAVWPTWCHDNASKKDTNNILYGISMDVKLFTYYSTSGFYVPQFENFIFLCFGPFPFLSYADTQLGSVIKQVVH